MSDNGSDGFAMQNHHSPIRSELETKLVLIEASDGYISSLSLSLWDNIQFRENDLTVLILTRKGMGRDKMIEIY